MNDASPASHRGDRLHFPGSPDKPLEITGRRLRAIA
jgi:hypothetical protein